MRDDSCCLLVTAVVKNTLPQRQTAQGHLSSETEKPTSHSWAQSFPFLSAALTFKSFVAKIHLFLRRFSTFSESTGFRCLQQPWVCDTQETWNVWTCLDSFSSPSTATWPLWVSIGNSSKALVFLFSSLCLAHLLVEERELSVQAFF